MIKNLKKYIRTVPISVEGVNFYDLNSLFASDLWQSSLVTEMANMEFDPNTYTHFRN